MTFSLIFACVVSVNFHLDGGVLGVLGTSEGGDICMQVHRVHCVMMLEAAMADGACGGDVVPKLDAADDKCMIIGIQVNDQVSLGDGVGLEGILLLDQTADSSWVPHPRVEI